MALCNMLSRWDRVLLVAAVGLMLGAPARADEATAKAEAAARQGAYRMQRFIVSAARVDKPWRYAQVPGFEILSRASPQATAAMLDSLQRGLWLQNDVLPKEWLPKPPVPYTIIIDDTDLTTIPLGQPHSSSINLVSPVDAESWGPLAQGALIWSDQLPAYDGDTLAFSTNVFGIDMAGMTYGSVSMERLGRCAPPLPKWLIAGILGQNSGVFREGFVPLISKGMFGPGWIHAATGPGTIWISLEETKRLASQPTVTVPPLADLFSETPPSAENVAVWESEAALLIRWALLGPGSENPVLVQAFRDFVHRSSHEPMTEALFKQCFGYGYDKMESDLAIYLKTVVGKPLTIQLDMPSGFPKPILFPATPDQIGRILGDWLRMEGVSLREKDPDVSKDSLYFAGRTILRAYREDNGLIHHADPAAGVDEPSPTPLPASGPATALDLSADKVRDPRLLSVLGLYAHDAGNNKKAREFLGAAAVDGVTRPRVYFVLAELRLKLAIGKPEWRDGKISASQASTILVPLRVALQAAPSADAYRLLVDLWAHSEAKPSEQDVAELATGVDSFPRDMELTYNTALICAQHGYPKVASKLIEKGLLFATTDANRQHFELMRESLDLPAESEGK
jgi:hypothetical protein